VDYVCLFGNVTPRARLRIFCSARAWAQLFPRGGKHELSADRHLPCSIPLCASGGRPHDAVRFAPRQAGQLTSEQKKWADTRICVYRKSDSTILLMKTAEDRSRCDDFEALNRARERGIFAQREMNSRLLANIGRRNLALGASGPRCVYREFRPS
jgi:hypothetical protein